ncbi:5307_t:CDS:2, partial [Ambispora gerdemannii]
MAEASSSSISRDSESKLEDISVQINSNISVFTQLPTLNGIYLLLENYFNLFVAVFFNFFYSTSKMSEPKFEDISVQINSDPPILIQLPINKTLNEIRRLLAVEPNIRMDLKMGFMTPFVRIMQKNECQYLLSKILDDNNLKIIGEQEPDWENIKKICKLEYGVDFSEKGPESAEKKAFDITKFHLRKLERPDIIDEMIVCQTEIDKICVKNLVAKSQITANLLWSSSISATLGGSRETENHVYIGNSITYRTSKRIKATISYSESEVKPTEEFIKAVDDALASDNQ